MIRKAIYVMAMLLAVSFSAAAQRDVESTPMPGKRNKPLGKPSEEKSDNKPGSEPAGKAELDTVFTITDYNAELPSGADILAQDVSVKPIKKYHSTHMIGLRYGVNLAGAQFSPDVKPGNVWCLHNYGIVYTYYNDLWDMLDNFGVQAIARLNKEGFTSEYIPDMKYTVAEVDLMTNLRFNIKSFRIVANVGPYAGYRIKNDRENGEWIYYDNRFDYGLIFGGGLGLGFGPFEFQLEANYKWGLSSYFHTFYYSDEYWFFSYPRVWMFSGTLYYKF
ncbi:MAG: hypothetical protein J5693_00105 [Bacteroidales bacterium]|nr:hypothetical protein [Bacteroidales bacterium]